MPLKAMEVRAVPLPYLSFNSPNMILSRGLRYALFSPVSDLFLNTPSIIL